MGKTLIIEPFYGGSHKKMIDVLTSAMEEDTYKIVTMTAKKWPWRARCSSLYISQQIPDIADYSIVFCSSVLSLSELIGLRPELINMKKIVYFHENQLVYPVRCVKERDFQFGYNQITTCLSADEVIFNSEFNRKSFLDNINKFLKLMPDFKMKIFPEMISPKCKVLYFPVDYSIIDSIQAEKEQVSTSSESRKIMHLVWPHRWEFDKNPELFFNTLYRLQTDDVKFKVSVLGESGADIPAPFLEARDKLKNQINSFGFVESKEMFFKILSDSDIVISTAKHEFFGVAIMEAVRSGCLPLLPNKLVYPEIYPKQCLYNTDEDLYSTLKKWCTSPDLVAKLKKTLHIDTAQYGSENLLPKYLELFR